MDESTDPLSTHESIFFDHVDFRNACYSLTSTISFIFSFDLIYCELFYLLISVAFKNTHWFPRLSSSFMSARQALLTRRFHLTSSLTMSTLPRGLKISLPVHSIGSLPRKLGIGLPLPLKDGPTSARSATLPTHSLKRPLGEPSSPSADAKVPWFRSANLESNMSEPAIDLLESSSLVSDGQCSTGCSSPPHGSSDSRGSSGEEGPAPVRNTGGAAGVESTTAPFKISSLPLKSLPTSSADPLESEDESDCTELLWDAAGPHFWAVVQPGSSPCRLFAAGLLDLQHSESATPEAFLTSLLSGGKRSPSRAQDAEASVSKSGGPVYRRSPTPKMVADYDLELVSAVRERDFECLRRLHAQGRSLDACNKYGESVMHAACRRGDLAIAQALMDLGATPLAVDDFGRTPLHDACWAPEPCLDLVALLLAADPQSVLLKDSRGSGPLAYIRKEHHGVWCAFLNHVKDEFFPLAVLDGVVLTGAAGSSIPPLSPAADHNSMETPSVHMSEEASTKVSADANAPSGTRTRTRSSRLPSRFQ